MTFEFSPPIREISIETEEDEEVESWLTKGTQVDLAFYEKNFESETRTEYAIRTEKLSQSLAGRHRAMFSLKCDMILTMLLSTSRFLYAAAFLISCFHCCVCINQVLVFRFLPFVGSPVLSSLLRRSFFAAFFNFDIYVIICLFKMSTRFFMIPLRVNCTTTNST